MGWIKNYFGKNPFEFVLYIFFTGVGVILTPAYFTSDGDVAIAIFHVSVSCMWLRLLLLKNRNNG